MNTPVYDFLISYAEKNMLRLHMPGHKGKITESFLSQIYPLDITEISGADSLFEADGIIAESENNASVLFKTSATIYSAQGSTLCIQAMLAVMKSESRRVIAMRNAHRAFLNACILLDIDIEWIYPRYNNSILSGDISIDDIEKVLQNSDGPSCVYITSPDYLGKTADIKSISATCKKYNAPLLVDNAHGAHLAFMSPSLHPIALGADLCCDSAHKMLPALTGAAYLHVGNEKYTGKVKSSMQLFASTSPSYLIMASLDLCGRYIAESISADINRCLLSISLMRERLKKKYRFYGGEPFHLTITDVNGTELAEQLRSHGAECEYADDSCIVLLLSPLTSADDFTRLEKILETAEISESAVSLEPLIFPVPETAMSMRKAAFSPYEEIHIEESEGRICAGVKIPCPPAVPIAVSGEIISKNCINIFKRYGISFVNVVK